MTRTEEIKEEIEVGRASYGFYCTEVSSIHLAHFLASLEARVEVLEEPKTFIRKDGAVEEKIVHAYISTANTPWNDYRNEAITRIASLKESVGKKV